MLAIELNPQTWEGIYFQDPTVKVLKNSIKDKKIPKDILLVGPTGRGKTTIAKIVAAALVCEKGAPEGNPCGKCDNCIDIFDDYWSRSVRYVNGAVESGIDYYREKLDSLLNNTSFYSKNKVFIVDEVHRLSSEAMQTFLIPAESRKNKGVYFIFCTTEGGKMKKTLEDRCLDFLLKTPNELDLSKFLIEKVQSLKLRIPDTFLTEGIFEIACASEGSIRAALRSLSKVILSKDFTIENVREQLKWDIDVDLTKILTNILSSKFSLAIYDLDKLFQSEDTNTIYNKMFKQLLDAYRIAQGLNLNKPYYEKFLKANYKKFTPDLIRALLEIFISVRETCGYYIDRNMIMIALIDKVDKEEK